jgi:hypothetical protein
MLPLNHMNSSLPGAVARQGVDPARRYVSRRVAADIGGISVRTLERLFQDGGGPPVTIISGRRCYNVDLLYVWLEERTVKSAAEATVRFGKVA